MTWKVIRNSERVILTQIFFKNGPLFQQSHDISQIK